MPLSSNTQTYTIDDFTPGIHRWIRPGAPGTYPLGAPPGSAAHAYRCIARPEVGLTPLPAYQLAQTYTQAADPSNPLCVSLGGMLNLGGRGGVLADVVSSILVQHGGGFSITTDFHVTRQAVNLTTFTPTLIAGNTASSFPLGVTWPVMDIGTFQDQTTQRYSRVVMLIDPISVTSTTGTWITVRHWQTPNTSNPAEFATGNFAIWGSAGPTYPRIFYHNNRMGIWQVQATATATNNFVATDTDVLQISSNPTAGNPNGIFDPSVIINAGVVYPEMGTFVGTWGSYLQGELVGIYFEGGGFLLYGDMAAFTTAKLTGLMGTAGAVGPAALTPIGMIYPRLNEAVYVWNGDNSTQNISRQIPDGQFTRTKQPAPFATSSINNTSTVAWGEWVMFPNNWLFDTVTQSWWLCEDPTVLNFQVHASVVPNNFLSSPGIATSAVNTPCSLNTYYWNHTSAVSSYFWQSNPIPVTVGDLVTLMSIEVVATNLTATPCNITIQPVSPSAPFTTRPLPNQTTSQIFFTVPPNVSGWRGRRRVGHADYNVQLAVTASNTNTSNAAPTINIINCDFVRTRPSGVSGGNQ